MTVRKTIAALALAFGLGSMPAAAPAWGTQGHTMINHLAAEDLPASVPVFVRTPAAVAEITELGPEEDRIKGAGTSWDNDNDPGHYVNVDDDGMIAGVVPITALPKNMDEYARELEKAGADPYKAGYIPYSIMDGFERVRKDFAIWRVDEYMSTHGQTQAARDAFARDRALREDLTLRDIGDWGHFVGDGCQPLHITVHFNGWGMYPNPHGYTTSHIHSFFETGFVDTYARIGDVRAKMSPYVPLDPARLLTQSDIAKMVGDYLYGTSKAVDPLYALYAAGEFQNGDRKAIDFTDAQLARGAVMFRNMIAIAWEDSLNDEFGYPEVPVRDILDGRAPARSPNETM